ncbi:MAG: type I-E CRISPR-associated protein Cas5/CasD [Clostridiales bacterium]|nr:type I-E CRISPR-associated protein Cas5/CasD [Clostridiales bacterium]
MSTLLIRLAAPMQAWGVGAKFDRRGTEREPTKSGVIGLIAAAMGRRRNEKNDDLMNLGFGIRIDREGTLLCDYHTARSKKDSYVTRRYYLSDAVFLVGLEGDESLLKRIELALTRPAFPLFLGRRSCPPEGKVSLGIRQGKTRISALRDEPSLIECQDNGDLKKTMRIVVEAEESDGNTYVQRDVPLSFDQSHRRFGFRRVKEINADVIADERANEVLEKNQTMHDPFVELEED